jgi:hypothetical protein
MILHLFKYIHVCRKEKIKGKERGRTPEFLEKTHINYFCILSKKNYIDSISLDYFSKFLHHLV